MNTTRVLEGAYNVTLILQKTIIGDEQRKKLIRFYEKGMLSKSKKLREKHEEAARETGLPIETVLDWIGNYTRKKRGKPTNLPKALPARKVSAYNMFVKENKDFLLKCICSIKSRETLSTIGDWGEKWRSLSAEERKFYQAKADSFNPEKDTKRTRKSLFKKLIALLSSMQNVDVDLACLGSNHVGELVIYGVGRTASVIKSSPNFLAEIGTLLKTKAIGKNHCFPYKKVCSGKIKIEGLPEEIYPLKYLHSYGKQQLRSLLCVKEISVIIVDDIPATSNDNVEMCIADEPLNTPEPLEKCNSEKTHKRGAKRKTRGLKKNSKRSKKSPRQDNIYQIQDLLRKRETEVGVEYLVKWVGFKDPTWEPEGNMTKDIIEHFFPTQH